MKRVLVIGSGGAGKSTFARRLHEITGLELIHLDKLYWKPNWTEPSKEEWKEINREIIKGDRWIIDGNFGSTMEMRMEHCDTIISLDTLSVICFYRALKRLITYRNNDNRPDMPEGCKERFDWDFLWWILTFKRSKSSVKLETLIKKFKDKKKIFRLKNKKETEQFLRIIRNEKS